MKDQIVNIYTEKYSKKGSALGFEENKTYNRSIEVKGALIHEHVKVKCFKKKKKVFLADLIEVIKPSPFRVEPTCPHANSCGGCSWQHIDYKHQLEQKQQIITKLFSSLCSSENIAPIIGAEGTFKYRNKMEFSFSQDKEGNKYLGLIQANSKGKVINLDECYLVNSWQARLLKKIRIFWESCSLRAYHAFKDEGTFQTLILREGLKTGEKLVMLTVSSRPEAGMTKTQIEQFKNVVISELGEDKVSIYLRVKQIQKGQPTQFFEMHLYGPEFIKEQLTITYKEKDVPLEFAISPSSFFQPNTNQAEKLFSKALEIVEKTPDMKVLDLYCGTGTLTLVFSLIAKKVIAVELNPYSIFDALENAKMNKISHVDFIQGDAKKVLEDLKLKEKLKDIDLVVLDPPRAGLDDKALQEVIAIEAKQILYISCHPLSQAENVVKFIEKGYQISKIQPVDQFPQTPHIENIVLLKKIQ